MVWDDYFFGAYCSKTCVRDAGRKELWRSLRKRSGRGMSDPAPPCTLIRRAQTASPFLFAKIEE